MNEVFLRSGWQKDLEGGKVNEGIAITHFPALVGRSWACDYRIDHPMISRRHCVFELQAGRIWVRDLQSLNGTYLNAQRLTRPQALESGDRLDIAFLPYEVFLPLFPAESVVQANSATETAAASGPPRDVLVVDDNADAAETLAVLLQKWGHHVQVAHDGREALEAARSHPPDMVLLDICLAGADGVDVAEQLRTQAGLSEAKMVGITGYDPAETLERSHEGAFQRVLTKPVAADELQEVLRQPA